MFRKIKIIIGLVIVSLVIILSLPVPASKNIKIKLADLFFPILSGSRYLVEKIFSVKNIFSAIGENKNLRGEVGRLSARCNTFQESIRENERLKQLLELKKALPFDTIACQVIARDAGTWYKTFIINKGKKDDICIDMPVIGRRGLIGRIMDVDDDISRVLLVTDVNSSIGSITQDTRTAGLVEGNGSNECIFNLISKKDDLQAEAIVVTSGLSRVFPKGLIIGNVIEVSEAEQGLYKVAKIKLAEDIDKVEEVLVLKIQ